MLFGTTPDKVQFSYPHGFITICAACGKGQSVKVEAFLWDPQAEGKLTTAPSHMCVRFTCESCGQEVQVWPGGDSKVVKQSKHYLDWLDNVNDTMEAKMKESILGKADHEG